MSAASLRVRKPDTVEETKSMILQYEDMLSTAVGLGDEDMKDRLKQAVSVLNDHLLSRQKLAAAVSAPAASTAAGSADEAACKGSDSALLCAAIACFAGVVSRSGKLNATLLQLLKVCLGVVEKLAPTALYTELSDTMCALLRQNLTAGLFSKASSEEAAALLETLSADSINSVVDAPTRSILGNLLEIREVDSALTTAVAGVRSESSGLKISAQSLLTAMQQLSTGENRLDVVLDELVGQIDVPSSIQSVHAKLAAFAEQQLSQKALMQLQLDLMRQQKKLHSQQQALDCQRHDLKQCKEELVGLCSSHSQLDGTVGSIEAFPADQVRTPPDAPRCSWSAEQR